MWIGLIGATVATFLPLVTKKKISKEDRIRVIRNALILAFVFIAILILQMNPLVVIFIAIVAAIVLDKKTYTIKRFMIYAGVATLIVLTATLLFRPNPSYVVSHIEKHPANTSLYVAIDGEPVITYEDDVVRPLASVVKIVVALEYAHQVTEGIIDEQTEVPLSDLDIYYVEGTDGGAHTGWKEEQIGDQTTVKLKDVVAGMITYSSNANTDYLIDLLGAENIDVRLEEYGITPHDPLFPLVSSLLVTLDEKRTSTSKGWLEQLEKMDQQSYIDKSLTIHEQLKVETFDTTGVDQLSIKEQRVWSDRLPGSTARVYGELLRSIVLEDFAEDVNSVMRELLEWPMEIVPENKEQYEAIGAKGGSTAFILNQAMYIITKDGTHYEIVLLTDDASFFQAMMLNNNVNPFIFEFVNDKKFRENTIDQFNEPHS